jgi:Predicted membrane protein (DUF2207)
MYDLTQAALHTAAHAASTDGKGIFGDGTPVDLPYGLTVQSTVLLEALAVGAVVLIWFLLLGAVLSWTRPADVDPLPASADLQGDEPPAVVSLLANRWKLNEDAAESTLIDLAARDWIELRQPGNDPTHTTVHVLQPPDARSQPPLTSYEEQVLSHVRSQAVGDVVPVTALTFRDLGEAHRWTQRLHSSVIEDARARGLTRRRFSPTLVTLLSVAGVLPAGLLALVIMERSGEVGAGPGAGLIGWGLLSALAGRPLGERDTPAGREAAARWLGLKAFLRNDEAFAQLPPAAVTVWDRYLSYGDALGITRVCSALLDLGMGDRKRVWSSFGGGWHRVRIRYPRVLPRYGATAPATLLRAVIGLVVGGFIVHAFSDSTIGLDSRSDLIGDLPLIFGVLIFGYGVYVVVRTAADLLAPRTLTGEVLWVELWKSKQQKNDEPAIPVVHYFAVDDGSGDRTTAWAIPSDWSGRARPGDVVTIVVRPWTRRVVELTIDSSRAAVLAKAAGVAAAVVPGPDAGPGGGAKAPVGAFGTPLGAVAGPLGPVLGDQLPPVLAAALVAGSGTPSASAVPTPATPATDVDAPAPAPGSSSSTVPLLTAEEVTAALGRPVTTDATAGRFTLGPFEMVVFSAPGSASPLVMLAVARGRAVSLVIRTARHGKELTGVGDEAWQGPDWVVARRGDTMIRINLERNSGVSPQTLPTLLTKALSRL